MTSNLQYPLLAGCQVTLTSSTATSRPPVKLPQECLDVLENFSNIPEPYDFALERNVLNKKQERDQELSTTRATDSDEVQQSVLVKMKAVTKAEDDVCIALLEENGYDLKTSIEAFFHSESER